MLRVYGSLGDGYWKIDESGKRRGRRGRQGLSEFPDDAPRSRNDWRAGRALKDGFEDALDPNKRVDTNLKELWMNP